MPLDDLLERNRSAPRLSPEVRDETRALVLSAADREVAKGAHVVLIRRRMTRLTGATVAAAVTVTGVTLGANWWSHRNDMHTLVGPGMHSKHPVSPDAHGLAGQTVGFKTAAEVIRSAANVTQASNPALAPYWKVVIRYPCGPALHNPPANGICGDTWWWGNDRPGVVEGAEGPPGAKSMPANTVEFRGQQLSWRQVNARAWTQDQITELLLTGISPTLPTDVATWDTATGFLAEAPASAVIRKQLWHALEQVRGVTLIGRANDALGRPGWLLEFVKPGWQTESVLIDSNTGRVLENNGNGTRKATATTFVSAAPAATAPVPTDPR